tara:strand:- start:1677 stop:2495 length:819 start_codon:yes stop_codon:yes gene_type:complete
MSVLNNNWWLLPSLIMFLAGILCPAIGTALIYKKKLLNANFISFTTLPGLIISTKLGLHPLIGGFIGGVIGALLSESPSFNKNRNTTSVINIFTFGMLGFGVSIIPLFSIRIDLEAVLFGDLLTSNIRELSIMLSTSLFLFIFFFLTFFIGKGTYSEFNKQSDPNPTKAFLYNLFLNFTTILVITSSIPALGLVSVIPLLSIPSILGIEKRVTNLPFAMVLSSIFGLTISITGLLLSIIFNFAPGPLVATFCLLLLVAKFFVKDLINFFKNI